MDPIAEVDPAGQSVHAVLAKFMNVPAGHKHAHESTASDLPVAVKAPVGHAAHDPLAA